MPGKKLKYIARGLEGTAGTEVDATYLVKAPGAIKFDTMVETPELEYATGIGGGNVEGATISHDGTTITLSDYLFSHEDMVWLLNHALKAVPGAATTFAFPFYTTALNTLNTFTYEVNTSVSNASYTVTYCFVEKFGVHADADSNNGNVYTNATIRGRAATAKAGTSSLGFLAAMEHATLNMCTLKLDAVGTAAGTASATNNVLKGFSFDVDTGNKPGDYASGRSSKDFSVIDQGDFTIDTKVRLLLSATAVTRISNMRAGTPEVVQVAIVGSNSRVTKFNLPTIWTDIAEIGETDSNGLLMVELTGKSAYSRTSTAQGANINVTLSGSTTVT